MKKLFPIILFLASCQTSQQEQKQPTTIIKDEVVRPAPSPIGYYVGAVDYSYYSFDGRSKSGVVVSDVIESDFLSEDERYKILDALSSHHTIKYHDGLRINKRKVYFHKSYREASERRQNMLNNGTQN